MKLNNNISQYFIPPIMPPKQQLKPFNTAGAQVFKLGMVSWTEAVLGTRGKKLFQPALKKPGAITATPFVPLQGSAENQTIPPPPPPSSVPESDQRTIPPFEQFGLSLDETLAPSADTLSPAFGVGPLDSSVEWGMSPEIYAIVTFLGRTYSPPPSSSFPGAIELNQARYQSALATFLERSDLSEERKLFLVRTLKDSAAQLTLELEDGSKTNLFKVVTNLLDLGCVEDWMSPTLIHLALLLALPPEHKDLFYKYVRSPKEKEVLYLACTQFPEKMLFRPNESSSFGGGKFYRPETNFEKRLANLFDAIQEFEQYSHLSDGNDLSLGEILTSVLFAPGQTSSRIHEKTASYPRRFMNNLEFNGDFLAYVRLNLDSEAECVESDEFTLNNKRLLHLFDLFLGLHKPFRSDEDQSTAVDRLKFLGDQEFELMTCLAQFYGIPEQDTLEQAIQIAYDSLKERIYEHESMA